MATYTIIGKRNLRKYTAATLTPVYAAATDAERVAASLCDVPWEAVSERQAILPTHGDDNAPASRDNYDAALFCGDHANSLHRAFANAAVYRYTMPDAAVGASLASLAVKVTSDPYNSAGVRLHVFTNSTGVIPTACADVRGNGADGQPMTDGTTAAAVAPRETKTIDGKAYWYPVAATSTLAPTDGLTLQKYLFLTVCLEDYTVTRGNWLEGSGFIDNAVAITTAADIEGWTDGAAYDLSQEAETSFAVVEGGVMSAPASGGVSPIRALTIQRTGDDFEKRPNLLSRERVEGLRVAALGEGATTFSSLFSGAAKDVGVIPSSTYVNTTSASASYGYSLIYGGFQDGTFSDLPGLFICLDSATGSKPLRCSSTLQSLSTATQALCEAAQADGGIASVCYAVSGYANGVTTLMIFFFTRSDGELAAGHYLYSSSGDKGRGGLTLTINGSEITSASVTGTVSAWTSTVNIPCFSAVVKGSGHAASQFLLHVPSEKKFQVAYKTSIAVSYVGTVTAVRPIFIDNSKSNMIVSGDFTSFGGKACKNCAIVSWDTAESSAPTVTIPDCDGLITPNDYTNFAVSAPLSWTANSSEFYVTGAFHSLGGEPFEIAAAWKDGALAQIPLPAGTRPPEFFMKTVQAGSLDAALWVDDAGDIEATETLDVYAEPKAEVTDAQAAFGLRRLYAEFYAGLSLSETVPDERVGAAFLVRGDTITVKTGADASETAKCWNLSEAAHIVPFSCPLDFAARKVKLEWGAVAATDGACVRVWLKRGEYVKTMPESVGKALHFAAAVGATVDGWEAVGTVTPVDGEAGEATFEIEPILDGVATLLFVAFVGQDGFNPGDGMTLPRGIGALNVNDVAGTVEGLSGGFKPDVTLIG